MIDVKWLRGMGPERLTVLLQRRQECMAAPVPESLVELAERLAAPWSVVEALRGLDKPTLQVAEALAALGGSAPVGKLSALLGSPDQAQLDRALSNLYERALALRDPQPTLVAAASAAWPQPLGLGPSAATGLQYRTVDDLKRIANALGISTAGRKAEILRGVIAALQDHKLVRRAVEAASANIHDALKHAALTGEPIEFTGSYYLSRLAMSKPTGPDGWGLERGMLIPSNDGFGLDLAAEVALALRGPGYAAPFEPDPPALHTAPADQPMADSGGVAAASAFAGLVTALLDEAGSKPIAVLKAGGIGARELKRLAKTLQTREDEVRLALTLGLHLGLWNSGTTGIVPTNRYDEWLAASPAERIIDLLRAWWRLPQVPLGEEGTWFPVEVGAVAQLRERILSLIPQGRAVVDAHNLAAAATWHFPYAVGDPEAATHFVEAAWRELELGGIVAAGAVTSIGKAMLAGGDRLAEALAAVGAAQTRARLQADLTAVVTGTPAADLICLLDSVADRETRGTASTWRFNPASVRRALDAGHTADDLAKQLSEVASRGLPQPLEYLLHDVARGHGSIRVREVASCLRSDDAAMLERLAADRKLTALGLRMLAPTVLASSKPAAETLAALRSAGYSPVGEDAEGNVVIQREKVKRSAPLPATGRSARIVPAQPLPADIAAKLLAAPDVRSRRPSLTLDTVETYASHLSSAEIHLIAHAIDVNHPILISYVNQQGNASDRVIDEIELAGNALYAWCHLRNDYRHFNLGRVVTVQPA